MTRDSFTAGRDIHYSGGDMTVVQQAEPPAHPVPSETDWDALFYLAETGMNECPWVWATEFRNHFPDWDEAEFRAAIRRCAEYLKTRA